MHIMSVSTGEAMFITFEGIEGCGKSTQIALLEQALASRGYSVEKTREPGGCHVADQIRGVLLDAANRDMVPLTELLLYAAARAQHIEQVIRPAVEADKILLCDRFSDATRAYQSFARGLDRDLVERLNTLACQGLSPDLTLLLDCPVETGLGRARNRIDSTKGPREERFELEAISFHQKVRDGYIALAKEFPERFAIIDAASSPENVAKEILSAVVSRLETR